MYFNKEKFKAMIKPYATQENSIKIIGIIFILIGLWIVVSSAVIFIDLAVFSLGLILTYSGLKLANLTNITDYIDIKIEQIRNRFQ